MDWQSRENSSTSTEAYLQHEKVGPGRSLMRCTAASRYVVAWSFFPTAHATMAAHCWRLAPNIPSTSQIAAYALPMCSGEIVPDCPQFAIARLKACSTRRVAPH